MKRKRLAGVRDLCHQLATGGFHHAHHGHRVMVEEYLSWDNQTYLQQIGLGN